MSATVPNIEDIAAWLETPPMAVKTFGDEMRPVPLQTIVKGYVPSKTDFLFERRLNDFVYEVIHQHSAGKPTLLFCRYLRALNHIRLICSGASDVPDLYAGGLPGKVKQEDA